MKKILMLLIGIVLTSSIVGCSCSREFTVTFDSNGGSEAESQTVNLNGTATEPEEPTREGYTFDGWLLDGEPFDFSTEITEDITLVASWIEGSGDITVELDINGEIRRILVESGSTLTRPEDPEREGYVFIGWYLNGELFDFSTEITENITLEARFREIGDTTTNDSNTNSSTSRRFTVTFDSNGGTSVPSETVVEGSTVKRPANPTRRGYTFVSWQLDGEDYDFSSKVTGNITLIAKWQANSTNEEVREYTVTFNSNGGSSIPSETVVEGNTVTRPEDPTREGYTFISWQLNGVDYDFNTKVTSNITLVAVWEEVDVYSLSFTTYDNYTPAGTLQVLKNGEVVEFDELLDANGAYVGKYNFNEQGMMNANSYVVSKVAQVKLIDGTIVNIE